MTLRGLFEAYARTKRGTRAKVLYAAGVAVILGLAFVNSPRL